ncbi:uncharacterized protein LOC144440079 [Glandiceps talaboti]
MEQPVMMEVDEPISERDPNDPKSQAIEVVVLREETFPRVNVRSKFEASIRVSCRGGIPDEGYDISQVEANLYRKHSIRPEFLEVMNNMSKIHKKLRGKRIELSSLVYILECGSFKALKALWHHYSEKKLENMVQKTIVTEKMKKDIGAIYMSLRVNLDFEEYEMCRKEFNAKEGDELIPDSDDEEEEETEEQAARRKVLEEENARLKRNLVILKKTVAELEVINRQKDREVQLLRLAILQEKDGREKLEKRLKARIASLEESNARLRDLIERQKRGEDIAGLLKEENKKLITEVANLKKEIVVLKEQSETKRKEIERLREKLRIASEEQIKAKKAEVEKANAAMGGASAAMGGASAASPGSPQPSTSTGGSTSPKSSKK